MGQRLIEKAEKEHSLCEGEIAELLASSAAEEPLAAAADRVRRKYVGDGVHLRGLIEFTNICRRSCFYCGLRRENERAERYRLRPQEIVRLAQNARGYGYRTVVLQGARTAIGMSSGSPRSCAKYGIWGLSSRFPSASAQKRSIVRSRKRGQAVFCFVSRRRIANSTKGSTRA